MAEVALEERIGQALPPTAWRVIDQAQIDAFATVTEDRQPIHLNPEAGRAAGFEGTVAHGFLTLSMLSAMSYEVMPALVGKRASVNYGFDRVRFVAPVPAGARLRAVFTPQELSSRGAGLMLRLGVTVEIEGVGKPALTADWLVFFPG